MPGIVAFGSGGVELFVVLFMVSLLKEDIGSDTCIFQFSVVLHRSGGYVDVHPADCSVFVFDAVYRFDGFENILQRVEYRVFTGFQCQTLMAHIL